MSTTFFEIKTEDERKYFTQQLANESLSFNCGTLTTPEQAKALSPETRVVSIFVHSRLTAEVIYALPSAVQLITTRSTGYDHIDLVAAAERGIRVCNVPTYGENTVAEHTFALILSLSRRVQDAVQRAASLSFSAEGLQGFDLKNKVIGIVGVGHIGLHAARIAKGFGMTVLGYDPSPQPLLAEVLGFTYTTLDELLAQSDIVSLHAPLIPSTHHLFNAETFARMKPGALLINTARGGLVETAALLDALNSGQIGGAGLDVLEGEEVFNEEKQLLGNPSTLPKNVLQNIELLRHPHLVITPHIAYDSREAVERIWNTTCENIRAFQTGKPLNVIRTSRGENER